MRGAKFLALIALMVVVVDAKIVFDNSKLSSNNSKSEGAPVFTQIWVASKECPSPLYIEDERGKRATENCPIEESDEQISLSKNKDEEIKWELNINCFHKKTFFIVFPSKKIMPVLCDLTIDNRIAEKEIHIGGKIKVTIDPAAKETVFSDGKSIQKISIKEGK
jgi:hypothetical protein